MKNTGWRRLAVAATTAAESCWKMLPKGKQWLSSGHAERREQCGPFHMESSSFRAAAEQISVLTSARMNSSIAAETRERSHAAAVIMMIIHLRHCLHSHCIKSQCNFNMLRHQCTISPASISPPSALARCCSPVCVQIFVWRCANISSSPFARARAFVCLTRCIFVSAPATEPPAFPIKIPFIYGKHSSAPLIEMESELFSPVLRIILLVFVGSKWVHTSVSCRSHFFLWITH